MKIQLFVLSALLVSAFSLPLPDEEISRAKPLDLELKPEAKPEELAKPILAIDPIDEAKPALQTAEKLEQLKDDAALKPATQLLEKTEEKLDEKKEPSIELPKADQKKEELKVEEKPAEVTEKKGLDAVIDSILPEISEDNSNKVDQKPSEDAKIVEKTDESVRQVRETEEAKVAAPLSEAKPEEPKVTELAAEKKPELEAEKKPELLEAEKKAEDSVAAAAAPAQAPEAEKKPEEKVAETKTEKNAAEELKKPEEIKDKVEGEKKPIADKKEEISKESAESGEKKTDDESKESVESKESKESKEEKN